jgi:ADP-ribosylglycohydrolase
MALCLANALVVRRDFIPYDQLVRYKWWYRNGYMSSTGECFDIDEDTKQSVVEFERRQKVLAKSYDIPLERIDFLSDSQLLSQFDVNCSESGIAGNGALVRLAPVPLFFHCHPTYAVEFSGISGRITHGDQIAYDACRYYGALIVAALRGERKEELLAGDFYSEHQAWFNNKPLHPDIMRIAHGSYKRVGGHSDGIRGKRHIVHSMEAALWAFWSDKGSFEKGVLAAVNLGDDTNRTAAIYVQLAGAYYGCKCVPMDWFKSMYARRFIQCLSKWIVYEGEIWQPDQSHVSVMTISTPQPQSNAITASSAKQTQSSNTKTGTL